MSVFIKNSLMISKWIWVCQVLADSVIPTWHLSIPTLYHVAVVELDRKYLLWRRRPPPVKL